MPIRLLHSLSLVAKGLTVGYETWPPVGITLLGLAVLNIDWEHQGLQSITGPSDQWEFPTFSKGADSPLAQPLGLCKEIVKDAKFWPHPTEQRLPSANKLYDTCIPIYKLQACFHKSLSTWNLVGTCSNLWCHQLIISYQQFHHGRYKE